MSSTNGSQNLLTNVFRPVYRYEIPVGGSTAMFTPRLDVCNIDVLSANSISGFTAAIGDENENVYVGSNAGNEYSNLRGCSNVTALGFAAASNISNTKNSVYIGYNAGANALDSSVNITIGPNTKGNGISNIYIGSNTGSLGTGSNNILIGHNLTGTNLSNTLLIGPTPTIYGNLSTRKVGIGRDPSYNMDISGDSRISYRLGVGMAPGTATDMCDNPVTNVPHSLDVSGYTYIRGALGINNDPADYTLNLNGNFKFDDGSARMILQRDPSGNSAFSYEPYGGKRAVFSIKGDLCAEAFIVPGATFSGTVTGGTVVSLGDVSAVSAHITAIYGTRVFGEDVSGYRGRFGRVDATDISGSQGTITTLNATTFSSTNFATSNIVLPGYLRDTLIPTDLDISAGNISNSKTTRSSNFIGTSAASNSIGGVTLSNTNITYAGAITGSTAAANNSIGAVTLSNGNIVYGGAISNSNTNTNNLIGGVTLSNTNISYAGVISNSGTGSNLISGVTLSNSNILVGGYLRNALTPSAFDISGGNIRNSGNIISVGGIRNATSNWTTDISGGIVDTSSAIVANFLRNARVPTLFDISGGNISNSGNIISVGGIRNAASAWTIDISQGTVATSNILVSNYMRNALTPSQFDISGGNISNSGTHIATTFRNAATGFTTDISGGTVATSNILVSNYMRNALTPSTLDISGGNISNSATTRSSNFIGRGTASNSVAGFVLSNGTLSVDGSDTFMVAIGESTNTLATSTNGITWTSRGKTVFTTVGRGVAWNGSLWVAVGNGTNTIATSTDGLTWTGLGSIIFSTQANSIAWGGNVWVAGGVGTNGLAYSTDGSNWTGLGTTIFTGGNFAAWNGSIWVAVGGGTNTLAYSYDGINWTGLGTSIFSSGGNGVAWNGSIWVAVGSGGNAFATSPDGITWTGRGGTGVFSTAGIAVAWNGSLWVAAGQGTNTLAYSSDGSNWTGAGASIFTTNGRCVAWNGYVWAAGGQGTNTLAYSFDGSNWTGAGTGALNLLTRGVAGRRYVLPVTDPHTGAGDIQFGGSIIGSNSEASNQIGGTTLSNTKIGVGTTNPIYEVDVSGQGATVLIGGVSRTLGTDGLLIQGYSNSGYIRPQASGSVLYLGASNSNTVTINSAYMGINKSPSYALDISASPANAPSININTWPRINNASNTTIVRGTLGIVGNTINWSNVQQNTISTNLMTLVLSNVAGCSFKINKSGIWSISWMLGISNGFASWIDASTNENSNVALNTNGTYLISYAQGESGTLSSGSWTGYLPSNANTFYKVRTNSTALTLTANSNYFTATFLTETSNASGNFPFN